MVSLELQAATNPPTTGTGGASSTETATTAASSNATKYVELAKQDFVNIFSPYLLFFIGWLIIGVLLVYVGRSAFRNDVNRFLKWFTEGKDWMTAPPSMTIRTNSLSTSESIADGATIELLRTEDDVTLTATQCGYWTLASPSGPREVPESCELTLNFLMLEYGVYTVQYITSRSAQPYWSANIVAVHDSWLQKRKKWWATHLWARWTLMVIWLVIGVVIVFNAAGQPSLDQVGVIIWPIIVVAILLIFRDKIAGLLQRLTGFEGFGLSFTLEAAQKGGTTEKTAAVAALGEFALKGQKSALKMLIDRLQNDEESIIREIAARQLGNVGDFRGVMPLVKALKDPVALVRKSATEALGKIAMRHKDKSRPDISEQCRRVIILDLINVVKDRLEDDEVHITAEDALVAIGEDAIVPVSSLLESGDEANHAHAVNVLKKIAKSKTRAQKKRTEQQRRGTR